MSLHDSVVHTLTTWTTPDGEQEKLRVEFLDHLRRNPDGVWRECAPEHVTASSLVVDPERRRVLLLLHAKVGLWLPSGGHCEPGDQSVADTALREAVEETGIEGPRLVDPTRPSSLDKHRAPCRPGVVEHHLNVHYFAIAPAGAEPTVTDESHDAGWFGYDALPGPLGHDVPPLVAMAAATW